MIKILKKYQHFFLLAVVLLLSLAFWSVSIVSAADDSNTNSITCEKQGSSKNCTEYVSVWGGTGQAWEGEIQGEVTGFGGTFGGSGGKVIIYGCLNETAGMWDGSCWLFLDDQAYDNTFPFGPTRERLSDYTPDFKYFIVAVDIDDGRVTMDYTVRTRRVEATLNAPPGAEQNVSFPISWNTEHAKPEEGGSRTLTYSGADISCEVGNGSSVIEDGETNCSLGQPNGTAQITITATGPSSNGEITVVDSKEVDVVTGGIDYVNMDFHVKDSCTASPVQNASVIINPDWGNGTFRATDSAGNANFGVDDDSDTTWNVSATGYQLAGGTSNPGGSDIDINVNLIRSSGDCEGEPPESEPPPPPGGSPQCSDTIDNDSDGLIDYPADPGCDDSQDDYEVDGPPPSDPDPPPPPPSSCQEDTPYLKTRNAGTWGGSTLPATMTAGDSITFEMEVRNIGNDTGDQSISTWYTNGYRLRDLSCLTGPCGGGVPPTGNNPNNTSNWRPTVPPSERFYPEFTLTAPQSPGTYTLRMQMIHNSGWEYNTGVDANIPCGSPPASDVGFGSIWSHTFNVVSPPLPEADITCNDGEACSVNMGGSATIEWCGSDAHTCANADSCFITPGVWTGLSGTQVINNITSDKTYTLQCDGPNGTSADSVTVSVIPPPLYVDLDITGGPTPSEEEVEVGDVITFGATTTNLGNDQAPDSKVRFKIDGNTLSDYHTTGLLDADESVVHNSASWTATLGDHTIQVCADWENVVSESNESNNCAVSLIQVSSVSQCSDGIDNDGDTFIDLNDPGCTGPSDNDESNFYQCNDGLDNDDDTWVDLDDPGCESVIDNDESNSATDSQCSDTIDNDNDGFIDGDDPNCINANDNSEANPGFQEF